MRGVFVHRPDCRCIVCNPRRARPLADRWRDYIVIHEGACWGWSGPQSTGGYGLLQRPGKGGRPISAHRLSYEMHHGPIPTGMCVLHICDNPPCSNPAHLRLGTLKDNTRDMMAKGRARFGFKPKSHCPKGHAYEGANVWIDNRGKKFCRTCRNAECRQYYYDRMAKKRVA